MTTPTTGSSDDPHTQTTGRCPNAKSLSSGTPALASRRVASVSVTKTLVSRTETVENSENPRLSACQASDTHAQDNPCAPVQDGHNERRLPLIVRGRAVVNIELLPKNAAAQIPVGTVVDTVVVRLGRLLTNKLLESGNTQAAELLAYEQDQSPTPEECDLYLGQMDCEIIHNFRNLATLSALQGRYALVEDRLLSILAQRARRELNTISEDPPLATRLAQEMENLLATSLMRGPSALDVATLKNKHTSNLQLRCTELMAKPTITWTDVIKADKALPASDLLFWANRISFAITVLEGTIHRLDPHFGKDPAEEGVRGAPASFTQLVKYKHRPLHRLPLRTLAAQRLQSNRWDDDASRLLTERNFHAFGICADVVLTQLFERLTAWDKNEIHRSSRVKPRQIETENFYYADSIRRSLHQLGESIEDALTCAEKLLHYCSDSGVAAAELMDDEIWSLYPRINRENLKQARLRVRHSDLYFPLSVAHRDWISDLTERALAKRTEGVELPESLHLPIREQTQKTFRPL